MKEKDRESGERIINTRGVKGQSVSLDRVKGGPVAGPPHASELRTKIKLKKINKNTAQSTSGGFLLK